MNPLPPSPTRSTSHSTQPDDSLSFSDSSLPSSSFSPPTITSLPPEFISEIFRAIPGRPGSESTRDRTLASLCLVNRLFLQLARPILYREVYVDFTEDFEEEKFFRSVKFFRSFKILRTLIDVPRCGTLVKRLRFDLGRVEIPFIRAKVLARLLTALKSLEGIEVINGVRNQGIDGVIVRCRPRLKSLEVPEMELDGNNLFRIFNTLDELEVYVGPLPAVHQELDVWATAFPPSSHLRRVAVNFPVDPDSFRRYIEPSRHVLTKLAISLDVEHHEFDLSGFSNLTELHIRLGNVPKTNFSLDYVALERSSARIRRFITSKHREDVANFASSIQRLLRSTQSTPIKYLTISTSRDTVGYALSRYPLFDSLPPSIVQFTVESNLLHSRSTNLSTFVRASRDRTFPHLESSKILYYVPEPHRQSQSNERRQSKERFKQEEEKVKQTFRDPEANTKFSLDYKLIRRNLHPSEKRSVFDLYSEDYSDDEDTENEGEQEN